MTYRFLDFQLDTAQYRLTRRGEPVHVEPLVFDLIALFAANPGVVIDRDRMIEVVWQGRFISDATLSSAVKAARRALGDSGEAQAVIETVRGRGFRFLPAMTAEAGAAAAPVAEGGDATHGGRPSLAVLPFSVIGAGAAHSGLDEAIAHDLIGALSRARWLKVIARGSSFRFRGPGVDLAGVGRMLDVRYCLTGGLEFQDARVALTVELVEAATGTVVWADRFDGALGDLPGIRADIVTGLVTELESQIQRNEALNASGIGTEALDAWQAFHLGLQQIHLFTAAGNAKAEEYFTVAAHRDPNFARAHAGMSYSHFQKAFLNLSGDRQGHIRAAQTAAGRALELDPVDPFSNFNMGRSYWLDGEVDRAQSWLERAVHISPNYAQGIYTHSLMHCMAGNAATSIPLTETAISLSPLDPMLYAMRASISMSHMLLQDHAAAQAWGEKAAQTALAHVYIDLIAASANQLAGDGARARYWLDSALRRNPAVTIGAFFAALPLQDADTRARMTRAFRDAGLPD